MKFFRTLQRAWCAVLLAGLAACGGGGDSGTLRLALTDAPSCGFDAVNLTIQKVRVHQSSGASDADSGWSEVNLNPARRLNLLNLRNGVLFELGQTPLPTGKYTQLRLILADNSSADPLANSVLPTGGAEVALKTPSGQQSGVKANIDIDIAANKMADFVIDLDACKSIVSAGNSGQFLLKPVVNVLARYISGVAGFVDSVVANGSTSASLQQGGVAIKATAPDSSGRFLLQPVVPGRYVLVLTAPGRSTVVVTKVDVLADTVSTVGAAGVPLSLPPSPTGTVSGNAPANTLVRVLQPLTPALTDGTPTTVEVVGRFVYSTTGNYSYPLPVNPPLLAPYVAAPGPLVFTADTAAAGKYSLAASLTGFLDKLSVLAPLSAGSTITTNFNFP